MILSEVMSKQVKSCGQNDTIEQCARTMADNNIGFLPVVDDSGTLIGTVTDRDITIRAIAEGKGSDTQVRDVYSDNPIHLTEGDSLAQAEDLMKEGHIRRIVVVDDRKKPIGVVSACDVVQNEDDAQRIKDLFTSVLEPTTSGRTVEKLVGTAACG